MPSGILKETTKLIHCPLINGIMISHTVLFLVKAGRYLLVSPFWHQCHSVAPIMAPMVGIFGYRIYLTLKKG